MFKNVADMIVIAHENVADKFLMAANGDPT